MPQDSAQAAAASDGDATEDGAEPEDDGEEARAKRRAAQKRPSTVFLLMQVPCFLLVAVITCLPEAERGTFCLAGTPIWDSLLSVGSARLVDSGTSFSCECSCLRFCKVGWYWTYG